MNKNPMRRRASCFLLEATMKSIRSRSIRHRSNIVTLVALILAALPIEPSLAVDLLGLYVGGAVGDAQVDANAPGITTGDFKQNHSAFKIMAGVHPISPLGAELDYIDFGHPSGSLGGQAADASMKGAAAFGLLYLPLPLPVVDVYAKAGLARLQSTLNGNQVLSGVGTCAICNCFS
jgi:hypothetical protein